jgi:hypothetical protein
MLVMLRMFFFDTQTINFEIIPLNVLLGAFAKLQQATSLGLLSIEASRLYSDTPH